MQFQIMYYNTKYFYLMLKHADEEGCLNVRDEENEKQQDLSGKRYMCGVYIIVF